MNNELTHIAGILQEEALGRGQVFWLNKPKDGTHLYTHPVKELTDEEIDKIENAIYCKTIQKGKTQNEYIKAFARAILLKAQEK